MNIVAVGMGTCGLSSGAQAVFDALRECLPEREKYSLMPTGCIGMCYREPIVEIRTRGKRTFYGDVTPDIALEIYKRHVLCGEICTEAVAFEIEGGVISGPEAPFFELQKRIVLRNCGFVNPESIEDSEEHGAYGALRKALLRMTPQGIVETISESGLRGRGGAGFPTGKKWSLCAAQSGDIKYVVCNADEGDPGAFMDRAVLESDPHSVLEGMVICAKAIGAGHGFVYCRAEYPLAIRRLEMAIGQARSRGYLGENICGSGFSFDITVKQGAGAFVCGEETALFASIEGRRGMPRIRPPFPAEKGLWQKPTNNNNVETFANVSWIIENGAAKFREFGTEKSRGTKVFALAGKVLRGGLAEVPMGITIDDLVNKVGGGIKHGRKFKAIQIGGPSGGCIPSAGASTTVDFESIPKTGAIMGSGGMVVLDDTTCMVEMARYFLEFTQNESCGKCTFCRIGTLRMLEILERITRGEAVPEDIGKLKILARQIREASLCALGQTAPNPVLTTLEHYPEEYEAHILRRTCPAHQCTALTEFKIDASKCTGCTLCAKQCPVDAIQGTRSSPHRIDQALCVRCGRCISNCAFGAIYKD